MRREPCRARPPLGRPRSRGPRERRAAPAGRGRGGVLRLARLSRSGPRTSSARPGTAARRHGAALADADAPRPSGATGANTPTAGRPRRSRLSCWPLRPRAGGAFAGAARELLEAFGARGAVEAARALGRGGPPRLSGARRPAAAARALALPGSRRRRAARPPARALCREGAGDPAGAGAAALRAGASPLTPGGALRSTPSADGRRTRPPPAGAGDATAGGRPVWIAVEPETWDPSRAARSKRRDALLCRDALEVVVVPRSASASRLARRSGGGPLWVPCGSLAASVRFYEWLRGAAAPRSAAGARRCPRSTRSAGDWAAFAADPTGDAPLPRRRLDAARDRAADARAERDRLERSRGGASRAARGGQDGASR